MTDDPNRARRQIRLLHVSLADRKFAAGMQRFFSVPEAINRWAWVAWNRQEEPGLREEFGDDLIGNYDDLEKPGGRTSRLLEEEAECADVVIFHYVDLRLLSLVRSLCRKKTLVGSTWGGDYAAHLIRPTSMYLPRTRRWVASRQRGIRSIVSKLGLSAARRANWRRDYLRLLRELDLLVWGLGDVESSLLQGTSASHVRTSAWTVNYYYESGVSRSLCEDREPGGDIVLGNSSTPSGNHLDAIHLLPDDLPQGSRLILPLSYGSPEYRDAVIAAATAKYGARAFPITEFLALSDYERLVSRAGFMLLANYRGQGMGALGIALRAGLTPVLLGNGHLHQFAEGLGITVRTFNEPSGVDLTPLGRRDRLANRALAPRLQGDWRLQQMKMRDWLATVML